MTGSKNSNFSLEAFLLQDTDKTKKKMKTYQDLHVEDYYHIIGPIEFSIASYYSKKPTGLTDKKVFITLKSLLIDLNRKTASSSIDDSRSTDDESNSDFQPIKKSKTKMTKLATTHLGLKSAINDVVLQVLKEHPITRYEFELCIKYILYVIDNRSWIPTGKGYLDWISNFFGLLAGKKKEEFDAFYDMISQLLGIEKDLLTMDEMIYEEENSA